MEIHCRDWTMNSSTAAATVGNKPSATGGANTRAAAHVPIPNLLFENQSRLDAMQFDTVDQFGSSFHVVVAKTSYKLGPRSAAGVAALTPCTPAAKLNVEDRRFDDDSNASVRQESDFAPYKPECDVIVNATAYAPHGKAVATFKVALVVCKTRTTSSSGSTGTHAAVKSTSPPLIDKTLNVSGERNYKKQIGLLRALQSIARIATLGLWRPSPWRLQAPAKMVSMPLRYEFAQGGQCRINASEEAARRVPKKHRIPQDTAQSDDAGAAASRALAHESNDANPLGRGFARKWHLNASRPREIPAPRIHSIRQPASAQQFWRGVNAHELPAPAGLGIVGRGWLPRRALVGTFVDKAEWGRDEVPALPDDFDFAYYNCAPRDQQCPYLSGVEEFTLTNLCRHDHPSATLDGDGNTVLRFTLPHQAVFVLAADASGGLLVRRLVIDTVIIDPDASQIDLVWRVLLPTDGGLRTARLMQVTEAAQIARVLEMEQVQGEGMHPAHPASPAGHLRGGHAQ